MSADQSIERALSATRPPAPVLRMPEGYIYPTASPEIPKAVRRQFTRVVIKKSMHIMIGRVEGHNNGPTPSSFALAFRKGLRKTPVCSGHLQMFPPVQSL